MAVEFNMLGH